MSAQPDLLVQHVSSPRLTTTGTGNRLSLLLDLAGVHARRMLRHPVLLVGIAWAVLGMGIGFPDTPYEEYSALTGLVAFFLGPLAFFAANLVASSERRSGADEWTPALPMPPVRRTTALLVACLALAGVALAINVVMLLAVGPGDTAMHVSVWHMASVPLTVLGGAVLGVAVAKLLPWPGAALLVMVTLVAFNLWVASREAYLGFYVDFAQWTGTDAIPAMEPGSGSWHVLYLGALIALAACGAYLRDAVHRWIPVAAGALCGSVAILAGAVQLT